MPITEIYQGKLQKGVLFLQVNAPAERGDNIMGIWKNLRFDCIDHLCYSTNLNPSIPGF